MGYSFWLAARVLICTIQHRIAHTTTSCYTSYRTLAGMRNSSIGPPWGIDLTNHRTRTRHSTRPTSRNDPDTIMIAAFMLFLNAISCNRSYWITREVHPTYLRLAILLSLTQTRSCNYRYTNGLHGCVMPKWKIKHNRCLEETMRKILAYVAKDHNYFCYFYTALMAIAFWLPVGPTPHQCWYISI